MSDNNGISELHLQHVNFHRKQNLISKGETMRDSNVKYLSIIID